MLTATTRHLEEPRLYELASGALSHTLVRQFNDLMRRTTTPTAFGLGFKRDCGKHTPIHRNTRKHPRPVLASFGRCKEPDRFTRYTRLHLRGERPLFHVSSGKRRRFAMLSLDIDATDTAVSFDETARYATRVTQDAWSYNSWIEPGRSFPRKQGAYARLLIDYAGVPAATRHFIELLVNRELNWRHPKGEAQGFHFDGLKGTTSYEYDNPSFDREYADEIAPMTGRSMVDAGPYLEMGEGIWILPYEAKKLLRSLTREQGARPCEEAISGEVGRWDQELRPITRLHHYERKKAFYGMLDEGGLNPAVRFACNERLEQTRRHHALLVTAPCFGRPHDLPAYQEFMNGPHLTWRHFISVLPDAQIESVHQHLRLIKSGDRQGALKLLHSASREAGAERRNAGEQTPGSPSSDTGEMESSCPLLPAMRPEQAMIDDPFADPFDRQRRMAMRQLRATGGDVELAARRTTEWWESPLGGATGLSPEEHAERRERHRRYVEFAAQTFDPAKARPAASDFRITRERAEEMAADMDHHVPQAWRDEAQLRHPQAEKLTSFRLAAVHGAVLRLASTVALGRDESSLGDVPTAAIHGLMRHMKMTVNTSTIAALMGLLRRARLIALTRSHWNPGSGQGGGRSAAYAINTSLFLPKWAEGHIPDTVQLAEAGEAMRRPPRLSLPSPRITELDWSVDDDPTPEDENALLSSLKMDLSTFGSLAMNPLGCISRFSRGKARKAA